MKEMEMAKQVMMEKKEAECMLHADMAMKIIN